MHGVWLLNWGKIEFEFKIKSTIQRVLSNLHILAQLLTENTLLSASVRANRDMFIFIFLIKIQSVPVPTMKTLIEETTILKINKS